MDYKLPNGIVISHINKYETDFIYKEIFEQQIYLKNGIVLNDDSVVFDVGANIGLFALYINGMVKNAAVYAFEPAPYLFDKLNVNLSNYSNIHTYAYGMSNEEKEQSFTYYPGYTILSGFYANAKLDEEQLTVGVQQQLFNKRITNQDMVMKAVKGVIGNKLLKSINYQLRTTSISSFMFNEQISRIDLLKIDAERSELDILNGIHDSDWVKIKQIVLELHDVKGVVSQEIIAMLNKKGFILKIEHTMPVSESSTAMLYAVQSHLTSRVG